MWACLSMYHWMVACGVKSIERRDGKCRRVRLYDGGVYVRGSTSRSLPLMAFNDVDLLYPPSRPRSTVRWRTLDGIADRIAGPMELTDHQPVQLMKVMRATAGQIAPITALELASVARALRPLAADTEISVRVRDRGRDLQIRVSCADRLLEVDRALHGAAWPVVAPRSTGLELLFSSHGMHRHVLAT